MTIAPELEARVRAAANEIPDPCSLAQDHPVGMADMGLIRSIESAVCEGGVALRIQARVTAPDCLHMVYFERELRARLAAFPELRSVEFAWDGGYDWTPEDMAPEVRAALKARRERILGTQAVTWHRS